MSHSIIIFGASGDLTSRKLIPALFHLFRKQRLPTPIQIVGLSLMGVRRTRKVGQVIEAEATDPGVMADIPAWCRSTGNELLNIDREGKTFVFRVRRSG